MATTTWNASKDARIARRISDSWDAGAGQSDYLPVGQYNSSGTVYRYRSLVGFSYSFSGMTAITSAILHMRTSGQYYVAFSSDPDVYVRRITSSWSEGSSTSLSSSNAVIYPGPGSTSTNQKAWDVAPTNNTWDSTDITDLVVDAFNAGVFYGIELRAVDEGTDVDVTEFWSSEGSTSYDAYISVTYSTNTAPYAPDNIGGIGTNSCSPTGDSVVNTLTPTFSGQFDDPDAGDSMSGAQVIVYADDGTTQIWDSGTFTATGSTFSKVYSGTALTGNTFYKWKGRVKDAAGTWSSYSALQRFKVNSIPNAPSIALTQSPTTDIKTLTPTFNMTHSDPDASDSQMLGYQLVLETSGGSAVWDSGEVSVTATVSKAVTYAGPALSWQTAYRWKAKTKDSNGAWGAYSSYAYFTTHTTGVPISLDPTGGDIASSITPTFTGSRATTADLITNAQIKVYQSDGTTLVWDSGSFATSSTSGFSKIYSGTALSSATTYKWQARVTSSIGGTSAYSALQTFITPDTNTPSGTAPVGTGITPVTNLDFTFTRAASFNIHELYVYQSDGTTVVTSDTPTSYTATTSKTFTYTGTLSWNTTYKWKVRVSADGGSNWTSFTGLISFTTDAAGIPVLDAPTADAWLGAPRVLDEYDDITSITNGTSASSSLETTIKQTGLGSLKIAVASLASSGVSHTYRSVTQDLSQYGSSTPGSIDIRMSSLTNVSSVKLRLADSGGTNYNEYIITPSGTGSFETKNFTLGSPDVTGGSGVDLSAVGRIGIVVTATGGGSVTSDVYVDDLKLDATAPSFDGTTSGGETLTYFRVRFYNDTTLVWDSGDTAGSGTTFSIAYGGTALTKGTTYYWEARYTKNTGPTGNYSDLQPFLLNSDPSLPSSMSPEIDEVVPDTTTPYFSSVFSDPEKATLGDYPTYYEVEVYRNSDSVLAYSLLTKTSLTAGTNIIYDGLSGTTKTTGAANPITYETEYVWRARYYDAKGARGSWSSYSTFKPSQSPTATITSPSDSGTVTSPSFNVTWSMSSPGSKGQNAYQVQVVRVTDAVTLIDTGKVYSSSTSYTVPAGYLVNSLDYDITLTLWDTDSLTGTDTNTVTASWTAPDPISDFTATDDESRSAVSMTWTASNLPSADFRKYTIYRRLIGADDWDILTEITNQSTNSYLDFTAANTVTYEYRITQWEIVPGDVDLESGDSDIGAVLLDTDSWYVIGADRDASHIFELPVTAGPFQEPVQQEVFEPLGTSRKVIVRGRVMGAEGNLQCKWPSSERDTALAQVAYIKSNAGPHILKSPFGDVWYVEFSGPNKDYVAGGHVTVTIVWTEVA